MKTLVLGLGNELLADEGIGIHAVRYLQQTLGRQAGLEVLDGGTLGLTLAVPLADAARLIVIDAAQLDAAPGTVRIFRNAAMDAFLADSRRSSVHEVALIDLMAVARLTDTLPEERVLIGIQPETVAWGDVPTPAVAAALPAACALARSLIEEWRDDAAT